MNLCDQCETVSHCTAHGCIPLTECINSGQVSAAQAVAHAEAGEVTTGWPAGLLQDDSRQLSKALSRDPSARAHVREAVAHQEAGELPALPDPAYTSYQTDSVMRRLELRSFSGSQMRSYAEAARSEAMQEAARLREALQNLWNASEGASDAEISARLKARAALAATQGASHE